MLFDNSATQFNFLSQYWKCHNSMRIMFLCMQVAVQIYGGKAFILKICETHTETSSFLLCIHIAIFHETSKSAGYSLDCEWSLMHIPQSFSLIYETRTIMYILKMEKIITWYELMSHSWPLTSVQNVSQFS